MRTLSLMAMMLVLAACRATREPANAREPTCNSPIERPGTAPRFVSRDQCIFDGNRFSFHALIPIHYSKGTDNADSRQLYQFDCHLESNQCEGLLLRVDKIERGQPIGMFDLSRAQAAEIISATGSVITIKWGIFRTFTVDLERGLVTYSESGKGLRGPIEGRGEAKCEVLR
jgi:hypothetical protein